MSSLPTPASTPTPNVPKFVRWLLTTLTSYSRLTSAKTDDELTCAIVDIRGEWFAMGGISSGFTAIHVAAFAFTPDAVFAVHTNGRWAVAWGTVTGTAGALCSLSSLYQIPSDADGFQLKTIDTYGGYGWFSFNARIPHICTIFSGIFLGTFVTITMFKNSVVSLVVFFSIVGLNIFMLPLVKLLRYFAGFSAHTVHSGWGMLLEVFRS